MPAQPARQPSARPPAAAGGNARPTNSKLRLRIAQLNDVGRARDHQEDASGVFTPPDPALLARKGQLLIVADGMGGHNAGEVASRAAVAEIQRAYFAAATDDIPTALRQALLMANEVIRQLAQGDASRRGMGTTAAVAVVREHEVHVANVGDSRVYLLRNAAITQITQDHSWVEEQVRAGVLTPEQARSHPQRNVITRALGSGATVEPDLFYGVLQEGDVLLLCSDGLSNLVSDAELLAIAGQAAPEQAVRRLVDLANERGGSDNISVIVARAETPASSAVAARAPSAPAARWLPVALLGVVALALVAVGVTAMLMARGRAQETIGPTAAATASPAATAETVAAAAAVAAPPTTAAGATAAASMSPTATLAQAPTATPIPSATPTRRPVATQPPARGATATSAAALPAMAPPQLLLPVDGFTAYEGLATEFAWQGTPQPGARFQVYVRKEGAGEWSAVLDPVELRADNTAALSIVVNTLLPVRDGGDGRYEWTVAVVSLAGRRLSDYASPRWFVYRSGGAPLATPPQATTPIVKPTTPAPPATTPAPPPTTPVPPPTTPAPPATTPVPQPTTPAPQLTNTALPPATELPPAATVPPPSTTEPPPP